MDSKSDISESLAGVPSKKRKIHLNDQECYNFSQSNEGMEPLKHPQGVKTSSKDPHRGLYPKMPALPSQGFQMGFQKASVQVNPEKELFDHFKKQSQGLQSPTKESNLSPRKRSFKQKSANLPAQSNTLNNYFSSKKNSQSSPPSSSAKSDSPSLLGSPSKEVKMYSPIKKKYSEGIIYVIDDNPDPPHKDSKTSQPSWSWGSTMKVYGKVPAGKGKITKNVKSKKSLVPRFNRDNAFLYSNDPTTHDTKKATSDRYGLLGTGTSLDGSDDEINHTGMSDLPHEVVENILCRLPLMDLYLNVNRVCTYWNDLISNEDVSSFLFHVWISSCTQLKLGCNLLNQRI